MKKKLLLLVIGLSMTTQMIYSQVPSYVPSNGLVGYWGFDGNANDQSSNGNNGTVIGATLTTDRFGNDNSAYNFDGISNYISVPNSSTLSDMTSITISAWINIKQWDIINNQGWFPILSKTNSLTYGKYRLGAFTGESTGFPSIYGNLETNATNITQDNLYSINQWNHIVITISNGNSTISVNGVEVFNGKTTYTGWSTTDNLPLLIGKDIPGITDYAKGKIDDIGIWNRALTQAEITAMYNGVNYSDTCNTVSGSLTNGLFGYWPFCGNANDDSGNGNNGVVNGASLTTDRFGNTNSAYSFDGVNNNIRVDIPNSYFKNDFTISTWVLLNDFKNTYPTFITEENRYLCLQFSNTLSPPVVNFYFLNNFQMAGQQVEDGHVHGGAITLNTWINVAIVNSNNINKLYINGVFIGSSTSQSTLQGLGFGNYLRFGNGVDLDLPIAGFNGKLDDIGIWNRALSQQEITQLYNQNQCMNNITVTDTLIINVGKLSYTNPVSYANNITLYPNPANTQVNISFNNISDLTGGHINIINSLGQQVATTQITVSGTNTTIALNTWGGAGLYFVQIINPQGQIIDIKKIILQ